jgi:hypothetical protein
MQKSKYRFPPQAELLKRATNPEIAPGGNHSLFEYLNRFRGPSGLVINLGQIQIKLRVIVTHRERFHAERFRIAKALFGHRREQTCVGKIKRIFRSNSKSAARMRQTLIRVPVAQVPQAFFELVHAGIYRSCRSDPVGHGFLSRPAGHQRWQDDEEETIVGECGRE